MCSASHFLCWHSSTVSDLIQTRRYYALAAAAALLAHLENNLNLNFAAGTLRVFYSGTNQTAIVGMCFFYLFHSLLHSSISRRKGNGSRSLFYFTFKGHYLFPVVVVAPGVCQFPFPSAACLPSFSYSLLYILIGSRRRALYPPTAVSSPASFQFAATSFRAPAGAPMINITLLHSSYCLFFVL